MSCCFPSWPTILELKWSSCLSLLSRQYYRNTPHTPLIYFWMSDSFLHLPSLHWKEFQIQELKVLYSSIKPLSEQFSAPPSSPFDEFMPFMSLVLLQLSLSNFATSCCHRLDSFVWFHLLYKWYMLLSYISFRLWLPMCLRICAMWIVWQMDVLCKKFSLCQGKRTRPKAKGRGCSSLEALA